MTFITGSITNANPGPALYAVIETAALALGWTLDDTVVIGGRTHKVLKSAAAGNTYTLDWYCDISYPTTGVASGLMAAPFEGYTAASDVGLRGPYAAGVSNTPDATTYSRYGATTSALETNWANSAAYTGLQLTLTTSAFTYWVSITRNRIIVMLSNVPTSCLYSGFFTPTAEHMAHAGAAMFPLITLVLSSGGSASSTTPSAAVTRIPKFSSAFGVTGAPGTWLDTVRVAGTVLPGYVGGGAIGVGASLFNGAQQLLPIPVTFGTANPSASSPQATQVGVLDGLCSAFVANTAVRGDTAVVGSDTWYAASASNYYGILMAGV